MSASEYVHVDFQVIRCETEKAFQLVLANGKIIWVPKSQVADAEDYQAGNRNGTISITEWIAEKIQEEQGVRLG